MAKTRQPRRNSAGITADRKNNNITKGGNTKMAQIIEKTNSSFIEEFFVFFNKEKNEITIIPLLKEVELSELQKKYPDGRIEEIIFYDTTQRTKITRMTKEEFQRMFYNPKYELEIFFSCDCQRDRITEIGCPDCIGRITFTHKEDESNDQSGFRLRLLIPKQRS